MSQGETYIHSIFLMTKELWGVTLYRPAFQIKSVKLVSSLPANNHKLDKTLLFFCLFLIFTLQHDNNFLEGKGSDSNILNEDLFCCRRGWQINFREAFNSPHAACLISSRAGKAEQNDNVTKRSLWFICTDIQYVMSLFGEINKVSKFSASLVGFYLYQYC